MRSRRILDREKTHELKKYSSACYFLNNTSSRDYKHNVTRVSDSENLVLASGRTVAPTRVVRKVHCEGVKLGESSLCATEFDRFFNPGEDSPSSTSTLWTILTLVSATVLHSANTRFSQSETLVTLFTVMSVKPTKIDYFSMSANVLGCRIRWRIWFCY